MQNEIREDMLKVKRMVSDVEMILGKREGETELVNKLIDAENLLTYCMSRLENAIVPPCKVGDKLYRVVELLNGERFVVEGIAFEYTETFESGTTKKRIYFWANGEEFTRRHYSLWLEISAFGKTVFLTREEAEKALAERQTP